MTPSRVVIVGSGFGGLFAARAFRRARDLEVTVVDRVNHHLFQPLLYQVSTGILSEGEIAPPTRDVLRRHRHIRVLQADVEGVQLTEPAGGGGTLAVRRANGTAEELPFDWLIAATGAATSYFGEPEFERHTLSMKSLDDALRLRAQIFESFEQAEWEPDPEIRRKRLTFAIVGGGPTGVELAGQIGELAHRALKDNFRTIDPRREVRIVLLDALPRILTAYSERQSARAARSLERLGVELHMNAMVKQIDPDGLTYETENGERHRIDALTRIWAAGVRAAPFAAMLAEATGAPTNRQGQIEVNPDCSLPGHPNVFAVGDMMALKDLPGLAEVAMQSGRHAARMIQADARDRGRRDFSYFDLGSMAAVSRTNAVAEFRGLRMSGLLGWLAWLAVHLFFLTGFKNRVTTVIHWGVTFLGRARSERAFSPVQLRPETPPEAVGG